MFNVFTLTQLYYMLTYCLTYFDNTNTGKTNTSAFVSSTNDFFFEENKTAINISQLG